MSPRGDDDLAVGLQHGIPDEGRVEIAALPGGGDLGRPHVEDLRVLGGETCVLQRRQQVVVRGRHERSRDLLALEIGELVHARAVARDELLGVADVVEHPDDLHIHALARGRRARAGDDLADRHLARRHGLDHVAAAAEHLPIDLVAGRLLDLALGYRNPQRHDHVLVGERHFLRLRRRARDRQAKCQRRCRQRNEPISPRAVHGLSTPEISPNCDWARLSQSAGRAVQASTGRRPAKAQRRDLKMRICQPLRRPAASPHSGYAGRSRGQSLGRTSPTQPSRQPAPCRRAGRGASAIPTGCSSKCKTSSRGTRPYRSSAAPIATGPLRRRRRRHPRPVPRARGRSGRGDPAPRFSPGHAREHRARCQAAPPNSA